MKRTFFATAILVLLTLVAFKPVHAQEGAKVGFRASPSIGWATVADSSKKVPPGMTTSAGLGFSFDFVFTYGFTESVGFKTGVNIATKSFKSNVAFSALNTDIDQKVNVTAIEIPIGLKFRSPEIGDGMFIVGHFGVNPELNIQNKVTTTGTLAGLPIDDEQIDADGINFFTGSFVPGAGLDWEFDWGMLEFAVTYHWGLLSITDKDETGTTSKLSYVALNLGYFF